MASRPREDDLLLAAPASASSRTSMRAVRLSNTRCNITVRSGEWSSPPCAAPGGDLQAMGSAARPRAADNIPRHVRIAQVQARDRRADVGGKAIELAAVAQPDDQHL